MTSPRPQRVHTYPPGSRLTQASWVADTFVNIGVEWYALRDGRERNEAERVLEREAVQLLQDHADHLPSLASLKRSVRRVSFLPMVVEDIWRTAFPPTATEIASVRKEWAMLEGVGARVRTLREAGDDDSAEALRASAVTFFNKWLPDNDDPVDSALRDKARTTLRKR